VSEENYQILRYFGYTSDSMNDVITVILNKALQTGEPSREPQSAQTQIAIGDETIALVIRRY